MKKKSLIAIVVIASAVIGNTHAGLVAHWSFDEGSGTTVGDSSAAGRNLTLASGSGWNASGVFGGSYVFNGEGALARTGSSSPATIASINTVTGNQVTLAFWARAARESIGSNPFFISNGTTRILASHLEWSNGLTYWDAAWDVSSGNRVSGNFGASADRMHHYVMTYDGDAGDMMIYKDNVLVGSNLSAPGGNLNWGNISNIELGAFSFQSFWGGELDDFGIWNEVLSDADRTTAFRQGISAIPEPSSAALLGISCLGLMFRRRR